MKKTLALLLSALLLLSLLAGCANDDPFANIPETPVEELTYTVDGDHILITGFVGYSKAIKIPETIEGLPVTTIGMLAFRGSEIETLILPDTVTDILNEAFSNCKQLSTVHFPDGLVNIHQQAFKDCLALERVAFPATLEQIGNSAFSNCTNLREARIDGNDLAIGVYAFSSNINLETLTLDNVKIIGDGAFTCCDKLSDVTFLCDLPDTINRYTFCASNGSLPMLHHKNGALGTDNPELGDYTLVAY